MGFRWKFNRMEIDDESVNEPPAIFVDIAQFTRVKRYLKEKWTRQRIEIQAFLAEATAANCNC